MNSGEFIASSLGQSDSCSYENRVEARKLVKKDFVLSLCLASAFALILAGWFFFDKHTPNMDEAGHILRNLDYQDLLSKPRPFRLSWLHRFITVDGFYPPTQDVITGLAKTVFGPTRLADNAVICLFSFILTATIFLSGRLLGLGAIASGMACFAINIFPLSSYVMHMYIPDFGAMVGVSMGLFLFLWWWQERTKRVALMAGFMLGICCLTKHIAMFFLVGLGLFYVVNSLKARSKELIGQLGLILLMVSSMVLPWFFVNSENILAIKEYMRKDLMLANLTNSYASHLVYYFESYWYSLSPLLFITFAISLIAMGKKNWIRLLPVWSLSVSGLLLISFIAIQADRYILPCLILPAFCIGIFFERLYLSNFGGRVAALVLSIVLVFQYISFNFSPYPIKNDLVTSFSKVMQVELRPIHFMNKVPIAKCNPIPFEDWGYEWTYKTIVKKDSNAVYLNILCDMFNLNAQTFELFFKEKQCKVAATTSCIWSVVGDVVNFSEESTMYYHWYLLRDRDSVKFKNEQSRKSYSKLVEFVKNSGKFQFVDSHKIADGSTISLYRKID